MGKSKKSLIVAFIVAGLAGLIVACTPLYEKYDFRFFVNETEELLDGKVFLDDQLLGYSKDGDLNVERSVLYPGIISLKGEYEGRKFNYEWNLTEEDLEFGGLDLYIAEDDVKELLFDPSLVNVKEIEDEIFKAMNLKRGYAGLLFLRRSKVLDDVAESYSARMLNEGFFGHEDLQGKDVYDRLKQKEIFYTVATENLAFHPINSSNTAIGKEVVEGWMKSPGHRVPILNRDVLWESVGIGVACGHVEGEKACYSTAVFAGFEQKFDGNLRGDYLRFVPVYDPALGFEYESVTLNVNFDSSGRTDFYVVPGRREFERLLEGSRIREYLIRERRVENYSGCIRALPGYGIILHNTGHREIQYDLEMKYVQKGEPCPAK